MTLIMIGLAVVVVANVIYNHVQLLRKQFNTSTECVYEMYCASLVFNASGHKGKSVVCVGGAYKHVTCGLVSADSAKANN